MNIADFDLYKDLLKDKSGLVVTPDKSCLLDSRLGPVAKKWGYASIDAMTLALKGVPDSNLVKDIIEAMTTNETSFFRDTRPFDMFRDHILPSLMESRATKRSLRIWCAAASSGQEPYSLSMLMLEKGAALANWNIEIIATDISNDILAQAQNGIYSQFEVQRGLPITLLMKYFTQQGDKWQIKDVVKKPIKYKYFNLLDSMASMGQFDIIFCRNVLIYFDEKTKGDVLNRMAKQLTKDGFLFLGGAETVLGITNAFVPMPEKRGVYVQADSLHIASKTKPAPLASSAAKA